MCRKHKFRKIRIIIENLNEHVRLCCCSLMNQKQFSHLQKGFINYEKWQIDANSVRMSDHSERKLHFLEPTFIVILFCQCRLNAQLFITNNELFTGFLEYWSFIERLTLKQCFSCWSFPTKNRNIEILNCKRKMNKMFRFYCIF